MARPDGSGTTRIVSKRIDAITSDRRTAVARTAKRGMPPAIAAGDLRVGPIASVPAVLTEFGIIPERAFARAAVDPGIFAHPDNRIPMAAVGRLLEECATLTDCAHFGLLVGARFRMEGLGALGYLMRSSATVGDAVRALLLQLYLHDRGGAPVLLEPEPSILLLGYTVYQPETQGIKHILDAAVAIGCRILEDVCGPAWKPLRIQLAHRRPQDPRAYHRAFGPRVRFDAEVSGIAFAPSWLDHPLAGADPVLHDLLLAAIGEARANAALGFADEVQGVLHQMVLSGTASAGNIARLFGIHERTLRRRLAAERVTLQQLVGQARFEISRQLLENTQLPVSEIAAALHYADAAVFSRAFRGWARATPRAWRKRRRPGAPPAGPLAGSAK